MRVVIVGGAGFIGTALAQHLLAYGWQPTVLDTAQRLQRSEDWLRGVPTEEFDFTADRGAERLLEGAEAMVHLACTTGPSTSMKSMAHDAKANITPSLHLFDAARPAGVRRVIFASSGGAVYGTPHRLPVQEVDPTPPVSAYGVAKLAIENYLSLYRELAGVSLRIGNPYGPYQLRGTSVGAIGRFVSAVNCGVSIEIWGDGSIVRDYIAISDVSNASRAVLSSSENSASV